MSKAPLSKEQRAIPAAVRYRLKELRMKCKTGYLPTPEEFRFLESSRKEWPDEYLAIGSEVFKETAPFGARQHNE